MDVVGIKSTTDKLGMEKPKDSIWKGGVTRFFPQSCQNGFLLAPFCWEHLISVQSFPRSGSPSCSWWIRDVQQIVPIPWRPWQIFLHPPGWEGSPAPQGSSSRSWASLSHASPLITSPHTWALTPLAPALPRNCAGAAPRGMSVCARGWSWCQSWNSQDFLWQWCCRLRFVLPTTAQGQAGRKRSQEEKTGSLFIQEPWQWIGCNYSLKYSLVLIIQVAGNRRNTGETQPR